MPLLSRYRYRKLTDSLTGHRTCLFIIAFHKFLHQLLPHRCKCLLLPFLWLFLLFFISKARDKHFLFLNSCPLIKYFYSFHLGSKPTLNLGCVCYLHSCSLPTNHSSIASDEKLLRGKQVWRCIAVTSVIESWTDTGKKKGGVPSQMWRKQDG